MSDFLTKYHCILDYQSDLADDRLLIDMARPCAPRPDRVSACWGKSLTPLIDKKALSAGRRAPPAPTAHDVGMAAPPPPRSRVGIVTA